MERVRTQCLVTSYNRNQDMRWLDGTLGSHADYMYFTYSVALRSVSSLSDNQWLKIYSEIKLIANDDIREACREGGVGE